MKTWILLPLLALLAACTAPESRSGGRVRNGNEFVFAFLESGPAQPGEEELGRLMLGHFENMGRMARAGQLLLAGPFVEPRANSSLRGLFVFDTPSLDEARRWVASDPAVEAGVLVARLYPFSSDAPLRELPHLDREAEARRLKQDPDSQWQGRGYVLVAFDGGALAERGLEERTCFAGAFGGELTGTTLVALDVRDLAELEALAPNLEDRVARHPWYGTGSVAELRRY